jgi:putative endonuclease
MNKPHYTYILASKRNGALFIGVTTDLVERVLDHKCNMVAGITSLYAIHQLVYFECHEDAETALSREQAIRKMHRIWKLDLIEQHNPDWRDLYPDISNPPEIPQSCHPAA